MAEQSDVIKAMARGVPGVAGTVDDPAAVERKARWLVRVMTSLLIFPGHDDDDERAMVEEFVVPPIGRRPSSATAQDLHPGEPVQQPRQRDRHHHRHDEQRSIDPV